MRRRVYQSDTAERDAFLKHLKQKPPPERPLDYGRQAPRILGEIVASIEGQYAAEEEERARQAKGLFDATPTERKRDG